MLACRIKRYRTCFMPQSNEDKTLEKLDQIRRILAVIATKGLKQREQILTLDQAGLAPKDIADLLGTSSNTVRVELVALRKAKRSRRSSQRRARGSADSGNSQ
jgi:DNA-directed RNA polymerase specialized sigma24 family protein